MDSSGASNRVNPELANAMAAARARLAQVRDPSNSGASQVTLRNPGIQTPPTDSSLTETSLSPQEVRQNIQRLRERALDQLANAHPSVSQQERPPAQVMNDRDAPQHLPTQQANHAVQAPLRPLRNLNGLRERPEETNEQYLNRLDDHIAAQERRNAPARFCKSLAKGLCCCCYVVVVAVNSASN